MQNAAAVFAAACCLASCCCAAGLVPGVGVVRLYYQSSWALPHFYYNPDGAGWVPQPGTPMKPSDNSSFPGWWMATVPANQVTFVLNDGGGAWDNNGGRNYAAAQPGVYALKAYSAVAAVDIYDRGCPLACSGHGACSAAFKCACDAAFSGPACSCSDSSCGAHGRCDATGDCACAAPWAACGPSANASCSTDTSSDAGNCGACGALCRPDAAAGIESASCASGACRIVCSAGWLLCTSEQGPSYCQHGDHCPVPPLPDCKTFADNQCLSPQQIDTLDQYAGNRWFTPRPGDRDYRESFGDYWRLVAHAHVEYDASRTSAKVSVVALHKDGAELAYEFDGEKQSSAVRAYTSETPGPIAIRVLGADGAVLRLQDVDLVWSAPKVDRTDGDYRGGQKGGIVELFGWPHSEIEAECKSLSKMGWLGVKIFPMQEQVMSDQPFNNIMNPWYFMYQPVSYRFEGRMGNHSQLRSMIHTCRKYGVRVYADAVINHMVGSGNDINPAHRNFASGTCTTWPGKNSSAAEMSPFYSQGFTYTYNDHTGKNPLQEFPAVPYGPLDFHCERPCDSWADGRVLNSGWLTGLTDLHTGRENVRERIADYLTSLLSLGFSGFRIDAAKHIQPDDLVAILSKLRRNMGGALPGDFITWLEVLLGGEAPLLICNGDSGYNYGPYLEKQLLAAGFSDEDALKVKIWHSGYPNQPDQDCGSITRRREAIQNDDADQQNPGSTSREMYDSGSVFIKTRDVGNHRGFEVRLFTNPYGVRDNSNEWPIRLLLSSYFWGENGAGMGVPDGRSDCSLCKFTCSGCKGMGFAKAHDPDSCGYDLQVYTRTHRDKAVINAMRSWMGMSTTLSNSELGLPDRCT